MSPPMQAPNINPIGPRINSPKNNPIPLPKIPFFEPPNFLFINNGKIKSTKKIKIEIKKVKIKNLQNLYQKEIIIYTKRIIKLISKKKKR